MVQLKQRKRQRPTHLWLTLALAVCLCLGALPATEGFMAWDHILKPHLKRKMNNLIRRVHKAEWVIGYRYKDNCPPAARNNGAAIEEAITKSLNAWLQPVRELNTGKPVVADFRYVPDYKIEDVAEIKLYDLRIAFFCDFGASAALVGPDETRPPAILLHRGTFVDDQFTGVLLHEIGHAFGLLDTYPRPIPGEEFQVSRGGLSRTIGHQPASVMSNLNYPSPRPTRISQDDANGIVWLYKFYHENLPLEDCIFSDYELEKSPDGCRPKYPLIFEIKHGGERGERFALRVIHDDENTDINAKDERGMTALQYAIIKGYTRLVNRLLQDIEVNSTDGGGMTALHHAVMQGNRQVVNALLAHEGIDVDIKDGSGLTALHHAVMQKNWQAVQALVAHEGIDVDIKDGSGLTALHHAVIQRNHQAMDTLLGRKTIEVNSQDGDGLTALHHAILQGSTRAVKALLAHEGIDTEVKDGQGRTALQLANELEYKEIVQSLAVNPKGKLATVWGRLKQID